MKTKFKLTMTIYFDKGEPILGYKYFTFPYLKLAGLPKDDRIRGTDIWTKTRYWE